MPSTRRRLLAVAALATTAGCGGATRTPTETATLTERGFDDTRLDPPTVRLRQPDGRLAVTSPREEPLTATEEWTDTEWLASTPTARDALRYTQGTTNVDAAIRFVAATDGTLLVHQYRIDPARTRRLRRVAWRVPAEGPERAAAVELRYQTRARGVSETDESGGSDPNGRHVEATLVRVPFDADRLTRFSVWVT